MSKVGISFKVDFLVEITRGINWVGQTLRLEAYQQRLSLQPNGHDAAERFKRCENALEHKIFQHILSQALWRD